MTKRRWLWGVGAVIVILAVGLAVVRGRSPASPRPTSAEESGRPEDSARAPDSSRQSPNQQRGGDARSGQARRGGGGVPAVEVARPKTVDLATMLSLTANIRSVREAGIFSKVAGYLESVTVRPGDLVRAGQVVAVVDHGQQEAQLAQAQAALLAAEANVRTAQAQVKAVQAQILGAQAAKRNAEAQVASAQASLIRARSNYELSKANHARISQLFQQGMVARQRLDEAEADLRSTQAAVDVAVAQVRVAEAQVAQGEAQVQAAREQEAAQVSQVKSLQAQVANMAAGVENARLALANTTIRAPWSGIVTARNLDQGAFVSTGLSANAIMTIADLSRLNIIVNVPETEMAVLRKGDPAQIRVDAYPDKAFKGVVTRIAGGVDLSTRTVLVEIEVPNPDSLLRPGMYAKVTLSSASKPALVVPLPAVVAIREQYYVWVVKDGVASRRAVRLGRITGETVEITRGLSDQEMIVVRGTDLVRDGRPVRAVPEGQGQGNRVEVNKVEGNK